MKGLRNQYSLLGVALLAGGGTFSLFAWFIVDYMPLVALGGSAVILGAVSLTLGRSLPEITPETSLILLEAGFDNIAALVEELGLHSRALYLPASLIEGPPRALIPLHGNSQHPVIQRRVEQRLIVRFGSGPQDFGVLVSTPGSSALHLQKTPLGPSSSELETALSEVLVGTLDMVEAVRVSRSGKVISVEVKQPALQRRDHPAYTILGSPVASIAATLAAQAVDRPVAVVSETDRGRWHIIELEVVEQQ